MMKFKFQCHKLFFKRIQYFDNQIITFKLCNIDSLVLKINQHNQTYIKNSF
ncbi:unnamed protein product [Paramecium octaurelia]|uniref:Uncharacterized protein n=1 Tax=Paramecium octaurelia TaxID=43137 RepID=A0A8S1VMG8_PAROT|nr:unnamed protein product [Paramecium octaurelia]